MPDWAWDSWNWPTTWGWDYPLVAMCDPEFIGYHLLSEAEVSTQVVAKRASRDKVGNVVTIDGKLRIIEYSDLNPLADEIVERREPDGSPIFWAGSTAIHVFDAAFLRRMASDAESLPFHVATVRFTNPVNGAAIGRLGSSCPYVLL